MGEKRLMGMDALCGNDEVNASQCGSGMSWKRRIINRGPLWSIGGISGRVAKLSGEMDQERWNDLRRGIALLYPHRKQNLNRTPRSL